MATKYTAYSEARSIARKRLERLNEAGYVINDIHFPSVKELKERGISPGSALRAVEAFLQAPTTLIEYKKASKQKTIYFRKTDKGVRVGELEKLEKQQRRIDYEYARRHVTEDQRSLIKAARKLGLKLGPTTIKPFEEYVKYREAQGRGSMKYFMADIVEDYMNLIKGRKRSEVDIVADFERYLADREDLVSSWQSILKGETPTIATSDEFSIMWAEYAKEHKKTWQENRKKRRKGR